MRNNLNKLPLGYIGQRKSSLAEGYLLGNGYRSFNPIIRRFYSWDSLSPFDVGGVLGYAYCQGNPVNMSDKSGKGPIVDLLMFTVFAETAEIGSGVEAIAAGETAVMIERRLPDIITPIKDGFRIETQAGEIHDVSSVWLRDQGKSFIKQYMDIALGISGEWDSERGLFRGASRNALRKANKMGGPAVLSDYSIKPKFIFNGSIHSFRIVKTKGARLHKNKILSRRTRSYLISDFEHRLLGVIPPPSYEAVSNLPTYLEAVKFL